ncbi:hypothetical protein D5125_12940 [Magnetovirga frankeli]|uniref:hypothetical protein n=1 Tax=Magnetovirga frankeli TaxID=947516 RepID=UPI001292F1CC|nr:hypothetical protein D5125_12940 [gamma proteobacterium SS-5]
MTTTTTRPFGPKHPNAVRCKDCQYRPPRQYARCNIIGKAVTFGTWRFCKRHKPIITGKEAQELIGATNNLPTSEDTIERIKANPQWLMIQDSIIRLEATGPSTIGVQLAPGTPDDLRLMIYQVVGIQQRQQRPRLPERPKRPAAPATRAPAPPVGGTAA